ncbi:alpha/beta hydrolase [Nocardioides sp.]|jgi:sigma-B regulation protein RsbQ|uniref:alpha/beta fold hydrolase n=1 Tax=Nocardioides sp. TaxID=35761 RepID=UPI0031FECF20|nr:alpha/beta hydrolase fold protein [Nocardioides sp.]
MSVTRRHHVIVSGPEDAQPMVFAHGFGCDQSMWRLVAPTFEATHRVVLFDLVGSGKSDLAAYDPARYDRLDQHAADLIELCRELGLDNVIFVGHSVSAMIGVLAQIAAPDLFDKLVLVGPSACYIDDGAYVGGFSSSDIDDLLELMDSNHLGWQSSLASVVMGTPERPELEGELEASFCRTRPDIARQFAGVTFLSDNRSDLARVTVPALVIQTRNDAIAPVSAGEFVRDSIPATTYALIDASGHCPQLSAPEPTTAAIEAFLRS